MKKLLTLIFVLAMAQVSFAQTLAGTAHDFSGDAWNSTGQVCIVCHAPHNGDNTVADAPLWNHEITTATYTLYAGFSMDATVAQPGSSSKLCLSCHDGTVALENFGGTATNTNFIAGSALVGTDLSDDHPISFTYDATLAGNDGGLHDPTVVLSGLGGTINADMLSGGQVQCSSCHDVHNDVYGSFLIMDNAASALCLTCHNK